MTFQEIVKYNRSYRRYYQNEIIPSEMVHYFIDIARLTPSGRNLQPLKYISSVQPEMNDKIFSTLAWAGYLSDWDGPEEGERPAAYIIILTDTTLTENASTDSGIVAQTMLLAAVDKGLGGCIIASVKRDKLSAVLQIPKNVNISLVIALGKPKEEVVLEPLNEQGDIRYWRDQNQVHHVPKRMLTDILMKSYE